MTEKEGTDLMYEGDLKSGDTVTFRHSSGRTMTGAFKSWILGGFFVFVKDEGPAGTAFRVTRPMVQAVNGRAV